MCIQQLSERAVLTGGGSLPKDLSKTKVTKHRCQDALDGHLNVPEVVTSSCQDDPVRREALSLHDEGDIAVLLSKHQGSQLLRQQVDVVDLRYGGQWTQRVAVTHGRRLPESHLIHKEAKQT